MQFSTICTYSALMASSAAAFTAPAVSPMSVRTDKVNMAIASSVESPEISDLIKMNTLDVEEPAESRPIYDPLSMYPNDAPERLENRIQPLEPGIPSSASAEISDPLRLYGNTATVDSETSTAEMSQSIPFMTRPAHLDGSMAGDVGFDPLGFAASSTPSSSGQRLVFMREAEIKHSRLAMLATAGWLVSEMAGGKLSAMAQTATPLLRYGDRVPSILNGGLGHALEPFFPMFTAIVVLAGGVEVIQAYNKRSNPEQYANRTVGDIGFDPLNMYALRGDDAAGRRSMENAELKHGRLAMLAITAFAIQEAFTGVGVVPQVLSWLHPHSAEFLATEGFASNVQAILSGEY